MIMGAANFSVFRTKRNINKDQWKKIRKDARNIFKDCGAYLQCGIKSCGWKKVSDDVRKLACQKVIFLNIDC